MSAIVIPAKQDLTPQPEARVPASPRELLIRLVGNRYGLVAISLLAALQASGQIDLAQLFVLIGLADNVGQVWGWGHAAWGTLGLGQ